MMVSSDIDEARRLLTQAESEINPARKLAALEEGIDLLESLVAKADCPASDRTLAHNLRHSSIRRLLKQLVNLRNIQFTVWFGYVQLLLLRLESDVKTILEEDASLKEGYVAFVKTWRDELLE